MHPVAEGQAEREVAVLGKVDFGGQRDVAVGSRGVLRIQLEILTEILPSVGPADIAARTPHERLVGSKSQPGFVLVGGQKLVTGHPCQVGGVTPATNVQMRRNQY